MFESVKLLEEVSKEIPREKLDSILERIEKEDFEGLTIEEIMFSHFCEYGKKKYNSYQHTPVKKSKNTAGEESYAMAA